MRKGWFEVKFGDKYELLECDENNKGVFDFTNVLFKRNEINHFSISGEPFLKQSNSSYYYSVGDSKLITDSSRIMVVVSEVKGVIQYKAANSKSKTEVLEDFSKGKFGIESGG
ncbi:MAG: hypothetical protein HWD63_10415 [Candidatus Parvibacillus calidus]|nr:MAG: hypothetical protein HWD63_10415 [Candidatus Parvibacillus calidus]